MQAINVSNNPYIPEIIHNPQQDQDLNTNKIPKQTFDNIAETFKSNERCKSSPYHKISNNSDKTDTQTKKLQLTVIDYQNLTNPSSFTIQETKKALNRHGIIGIKGIPDYQINIENLINDAKKFYSLSPEEKEKYSPNRKAGEWVGYEMGKQKFRREDGSEVLSTSKCSYYAYVTNGRLDPQVVQNIWPPINVCNLETTFMTIGYIMEGVIKKVIDITGCIQNTPILPDSFNAIGRLLQYTSSDSSNSNPWCEAHFDHGMFTALIPAYYWRDNEHIQEPEEAGFFVTLSDNECYKVVVDDPTTLLLLVGEFAQLVTNGQLQAIKHEVRRALDPKITRITQAVFLCPDPNETIISKDKLAQTDRYKMKLIDGTIIIREDGACTYSDWHENSLNQNRIRSSFLQKQELSYDSTGSPYFRCEG